MSVCPICLDSLTENTQSLPCGHVFHVECSNVWTNETNGCPVCRVPVDSNKPVQKLRSDDIASDTDLAIRIALDDLKQQMGPMLGLPMLHPVDQEPLDQVLPIPDEKALHDMKVIDNINDTALEHAIQQSLQEDNFVQDDLKFVIDQSLQSLEEKNVGDIVGQCNYCLELFMSDSLIVPIKCSRCHMVCYCGDSCLKSDIGNHKKWCDAQIASRYKL